MIGLFQENGPFRTHEMTNTSMGLFENPFSWSTIAHMLFIDFPIGTGLSYVNTSQFLPHSSSQSAEHLYSFLHTFLFTLYPQYQNNSLYLTGESYAGKYITEAAHFILQQNEISSAKINLRGVAMGDALIDPILQRSIKPDQSYWSGLMSFLQRSQLQGLQSECIRQIQNKNFTQIDSACDTIKSQLLLASGIVNIYDIRRMDPSTNKTQIEIYLQQPIVRQALHINSQFKKQYLSCEKKTVYESMQPEILATVKHFIPEIMSHQVPILLYNGNFDLQDGPIGTEHTLIDLFGDTWHNAPRQLWFVNQSVAGTVQQIPYLTFVTIFGSGHFAPRDQPFHSLQMMQQFVKQEEFCKPNEMIPVKYSALTPSGLHHHLTYDSQTKQYHLPCDISQRICESILQHCHHHGTCVRGRCHCQEGYVGDSCAFAMLPLVNQHSFMTSLQQTILQQEWQYYTLVTLQDQINLSVQFSHEEQLDQEEFFVGKGLGTNLPSQKICIYAKEDVLPSSIDFDWVYCIDTMKHLNLSLQIPLLSAHEKQSKKWIFGVLNTHSFEVQYELHITLSKEQDKEEEGELDEDLIAALE